MKLGKPLGNKLQYNLSEHLYRELAPYLSDQLNQRDSDRFFESIDWELYSKVYDGMFEVKQKLEK